MTTCWLMLNVCVFIIVEFLVNRWSKRQREVKRYWLNAVCVWLSSV